MTNDLTQLRIDSAKALGKEPILAGGQVICGQDPHSYIWQPDLEGHEAQL